MKKSILLMVVFLNAFMAQAQEFETVVQETIFNSSDKVVIDREQIEKSKAPNITTLLSTQANISASSTPFQPSSLFIRGGDSGHVLILIDGVPFYDAATIQRTFNLNNLDIRTVEKIEIIKGSQSVLFGGQAMSGVIKITTIPKTPRKPTVILEAGSFDKANVGATYQGTMSEGIFSANARLGQKNNRSPVLDSDKIYPSENVATDLSYRRDADWFIQGKATYLADDSFSASTSYPSYKIIDADDFEIVNEQTGVSLVTGSTKNQFQPQLGISHQWSYSTYDQPVSVSNPQLTHQVYEGQTTQVRGEARVLNLEHSQVDVGASYTKEKMRYSDQGLVASDVFSELRGLFAKYDQDLGSGIKASLGGRFETWEYEEGVLTGQLGLVFQENTKLEVATGFKSPSLFQLYSSYGNPDLEAEKSVSYSLSHQQKLNDGMNASMTIFYSEFSNLMATQGTPRKFYNIGKSSTKGVEAAYGWTIDPNNQVSVVAGYQEPWDETNKQWLIRRPLVSGSARYGYTWESFQIQAEIVGVGPRSDKNGTSTYTELPGYVIGNLSASQYLKENFELYLRLDNITDYRYEQSYSYYSEGFAATLGMVAQF